MQVGIFSPISLTRKSEHRIGRADRVTSHHEGLDPESELSVEPRALPVPSRISASSLPLWTPCLCHFQRLEHFPFGHGGLDNVEGMCSIYSAAVKRKHCRMILILTQERKKERDKRKIRAVPVSILSPRSASEAPSPTKEWPVAQLYGKSEPGGPGRRGRAPGFHVPLQAQGRRLTTADRRVTVDLLQLKTHFEIYREPLQSSACLAAASGQGEMGSLPAPVTSGHRRPRGSRLVPGETHCWSLGGKADIWFPGPCWGTRCP